MITAAMEQLIGLSEEQLQKAAEVDSDAATRLREIHSQFRAMDRDAFVHARHWSVFRCYGG